MQSLRSFFYKLSAVKPHAFRRVDTRRPMPVNPGFECIVRLSFATPDQCCRQNTHRTIMSGVSNTAWISSRCDGSTSDGCYPALAVLQSRIRIPLDCTPIGCAHGLCLFPFEVSYAPTSLQRRINIVLRHLHVYLTGITSSDILSQRSGVLSGCILNVRLCSNHP